jgi:hypothetical protein
LSGAPFWTLLGALFTFVNYECYSIATFHVFIANKAFFHYSVSMLEDGKNPNGIDTLLLLLLLFLIHPSKRMKTRNTRGKEL